MVIFFLLFFMLLPSSVHAITADELRELSDVWESKERERAERIETENLDKLIPKEPEKKKPSIIEASPPADGENPEAIVKESPEDNRPMNVEEVVPGVKEVFQEEGVNISPNKPRSEKYKMDAAKASGILEDRGLIFLPEAEAAPLPGSFPSWMFKQNTDGKYFPPPRQGGFGALTDAVSPDKTRIFGIRIGTWIKGELKRSASNSEPGLIEIYTTEDVSGKKRTLPSGTTLFAQKGYNAGTKKMDLIVEKGITPEGLEFEIEGLIFDLQRTAGLMGVVTTDSDLIVERSTSKGLLAAGGEVVNQLGQGSIVGTAGSAATESILSDSENAVEEKTRLKQTIRSFPQQLLIRVEETF